MTALSIADLARHPDWRAIKERMAAKISAAGNPWTVELVACPTTIGTNLWYLVCPQAECGRRRRSLWLVDGQLACARCHGLPAHPDHALSSGRFVRNVVRRARQIQRIDTRLECRARPNTTARLLSRRRRLLEQLAGELSHQRERMAAALAAVGESLPDLSNL